MKRILITFLLLLGTFSLLFAGGAKEEAVELKQVLTITVPWAGDELAQFLPVLRAFEEKENVKVKALTYRGEDLSSILPAQFEAGQAMADIIFIWQWWTRENSQYAVDLSDVWNPEKDVFIPSALEVGGRVLSIPYVLVAKPGFWYRRSFFEKNGLKEPKSWDDFTQLLRKIGGIPGIKNPIVSGDGVGWPLSDVTEHFIICFGGAELQNNLIDKKVKWTDPKVRSIFADRLVPLLKEDAFSDPVEWTQAVEIW